MIHPPKGTHRGRAPDRILDLLDIDGGWWDAATLADRLGLEVGTVKRALHRLHQKGFVRKRSAPARIEHPPIDFGGRRDAQGNRLSQRRGFYVMRTQNEWRAS